MAKIREKQRKQSAAYDIYHIGVLDGIRALAVIIVVWFHFWQQSWLMPVVGDVSFDWIPRTGYLLVDCMILLSGFCLFLPYARSMVYGEKTPSTPTFYMKRVARIMPSYYIAVLIALFCFALPMKEYATNTDMWKDFIPHLTFTHNLFPESATMTHLNGVLWTVAVEMQFYLFFPLLAKAFSKKPMTTYWCMTAVGVISSLYISRHWDTINQGLVVNQTLTFASVYANGMLGAWLYVAMTKDRQKNHAESVLWTVIAVASIGIYQVMCQNNISYTAGSRWQVDYRYLLSLVFLLFVISVIMSVDWFHKIWDNRVMRYLAAISYNLYICHQYISVKLKEMHIPAWEGDTAPNELGDKEWMWKYFLLCIVLSLLIATAMTYLVERPAAKLIMRLWNGRGGKSAEAVASQNQNALAGKKSDKKNSGKKR